MRRSTSYATAARAVRRPVDILSGLHVELDPKDVGTSGSAVTQFNNTNGVGGPCVQPLDAQRALFVANDAAFANQPVVQFGGTSSGNSDWYPLPGDLIDLTEGEVFVVLNQTGGASNVFRGLWTIGGHGTGTLYPDTSTSGIFDGFGSTTRYDYGVVSTVNVAHIYNVQSTPGAYSAWLSNQGVVFSDFANTVGFAAAPRFGIGAGNTTFFNGRLAYLALTDQVQTAAARAEMLSYLANRFGIALP